MHIAKIILCLFLFLPLSGFSQNIPMTADEAKSFKAEIARKTQSHHSLSGEFVQKRHLEFMTTDDISTGKFYFLAPGKLKWEYLQPFQYGMVFNNGKLYVISDGEKNEFEVSGNELFGKLIELIAGTINGKMLSSPDFESEFFKNQTYSIAKLVPVNPIFDEVLTEIWLFFEPSSYIVQRVEMLAPSGDSIQIEFKNIKINQQIATSVFED